MKGFLGPIHDLSVLKQNCFEKTDLRYYEIHLYSTCTALNKHLHCTYKAPAIPMQQHGQNYLIYFSVM